MAADGARADIYWRRRAEQQSIMAAAIYESTARESDAKATTAGLGEVAD